MSVRVVGVVGVGQPVLLRAADMAIGEPKVGDTVYFDVEPVKLECTSTFDVFAFCSPFLLIEVFSIGFLGP